MWTRTFTKKSTCLLCDAKVDPKSEVLICSTSSDVSVDTWAHGSVTITN